MPCEPSLSIIQRQSGQESSKNPGFLSFGSEKKVILGFERPAWEAPRLQDAMVMPGQLRDGRHRGRPDHAARVTNADPMPPRPPAPGSSTRNIRDDHQFLDLIE